VFPRKTGQRRVRGVTKKPVGFRAPDDVAAWLAELKKDGADQTDVIIRSLRLAREIEAKMGNRWWEVEYQARAQDVEPGARLADLALAQLDAEKGIPPKHSKK
jgi:hypothetical protein